MQISTHYVEFNHEPLSSDLLPLQSDQIWTQAITSEPTIEVRTKDINAAIRCRTTGRRDYRLDVQLTTVSLTCCDPK